MARTITKGIDYTSKDYESFRSDMIKALQQRIPEYTDTRESDAGIVIIELLAMGLDILSFYQDVYANEVYLTTAIQQENIIKWCSMLGYTPRNSSCAKFKQVFVLNGVQDRDTVIPKGTQIKTNDSFGETSVVFETMDDLTIPAGKLGNEVDSITKEYVYTVDVFEGESIEGEILGSSNGSKTQKFTLFYPKAIIDDTFNVYVDSGFGLEKWTRVNNFVESTFNNNHYMVNVESNNTVSVTFGDGVFGKIPPVGDNNIYVSYRIGGGEAGNVSKNSITSLPSKMAIISETFNPYDAYELGQERESTEEIKRNAPVANRTLWGAITLEDFSDVLVDNFDFVVDAEAKRDPSNADNVIIHILLKDNAPLTEEVRQQLLDFFDANKGGRKVIGSDTIFIEPPTFVGLNIKVRLIVQDTFIQEEVKSKVEEYIMNYFDEGKYGFRKEFSYTGFAHEMFTNIIGIKALSFIHYVSDEEILSPKEGEIFRMSTLDIVVSGGV